MSEKEYTVIHITSPEVAEVARQIKPELIPLDYISELEGRFLVLGFPGAGLSSLVQPAIFNKTFEHMPAGPRTVLEGYKRKPIDDDPTRKTFVRGRT